MTTAVDWYDHQAETMAALYERASFDSVHAWLAELLPPCPASVLDVGAGSGRDASWFAANGYSVVAVEPSTSMRTIAKRLHSEAPIHWIDDHLPILDIVNRIGLSYDLILLSAVWMHVSGRQRAQAFRTLLSLLKPGGILAMTLREGPANREAGIHHVSLSELETLMHCQKTIPELRFEASCRLELDGSSWNQVAIRLPADLLVTVES